MKLLSLMPSILWCSSGATEDNFYKLEKCKYLANEKQKITMVASREAVELSHLQFSKPNWTVSQLGILILKQPFQGTAQMLTNTSQEESRLEHGLYPFHNNSKVEEDIHSCEFE